MTVSQRCIPIVHPRRKKVRDDGFYIRFLGGSNNNTGPSCEGKKKKKKVMTDLLPSSSVHFFVLFCYYTSTHSLSFNHVTHTPRCRPWADLTAGHLQRGLSHLKGSMISPRRGHRYCAKVRRGGVIRFLFEKERERKLVYFTVTYEMLFFFTRYSYVMAPNLLCFVKMDFSMLVGQFSEGDTSQI